MGMNSDKIKILVKWVNDLCQAPNLKSKEEADLIQIDGQLKAIISGMLEDCSKSPVFAVAIIQHLREYGIDLLTLTGETADAFRGKFGPHVDRLGENDLVQIKKISNKLFN